MYKLALFPIHIFQNNIRENHILKDELLKKIEDQHNNSKLKIPEGWTTDNLCTSFSYEDLNYSLFGNTRTLFEYNRYVAKFFDLPVSGLIIMIMETGKKSTHIRQTMYFNFRQLFHVFIF